MLVLCLVNGLGRRCQGFCSWRKEKEKSKMVAQVCSNVCGCVPQKYCSHPGGKVVITTMWHEAVVTQPLGNPSTLQLAAKQDFIMLLLLCLIRCTYPVVT